MSAETFESVKSRPPVKHRHGPCAAARSKQSCFSPTSSFELRRENELKLPHDWLCYLAPEIVREMAPGKDEDKLPFSKAADIYAFG